MASLKKKKPRAQKISNMKKQPKATDFTVNRATGKRTLSGAEASRRDNAAGLSRSVSNRSDNAMSNQGTRGVYESRISSKQNLPVSSGGKISGTSFGKKFVYFPAGTRTKKERGR